MVADFHSYHWKNIELEDAELASAHDELADPTELDAYLQAFRTLLHSGHTAAAGIALDHFQYSGALTRFGGDSVVEQYAPEVLTVARELLRQPPTPEDADTFEGANHASALLAMMNIGEPADADLIADALERAVDVNVRSAACMAAPNALAGETPSPRLMAALGAVAFDESLEGGTERTDALSALSEVDDPEVTALLVRALESSEPLMQVYGALGLTTHSRFHAHRERVEQVAATWPKDAPGMGMATFVWERLTGFHSTYWVGAELTDPKLLAAHTELMFPTGEKAYDRAFRLMLHSEDAVAVGIAFDYFENGDGLQNFLNEDDVEAYAPEVLARARKVLRQPPSPAELSPETGTAANHISALNAIGARWAVPADAELIVDVLEQATTSDVRDRALWVAYGALDEADPPYQRLIDVVSRYVFDPALADHHETALRVLGEALGPEANPLLVRAAQSDDFDIQVHAAWQLSRPERIDAHRNLLEELVESWPVRVPSSAHDAGLVRGAVLGGMHSENWQGTRLTDPELYRAHRELRKPSDEETYRRALHALLDSGDSVAVGIALDHWSHEKGLEKHWGEEAYAAEVLTRIRELLRQPPSPAELSPETGAGANHLSALDALRVSQSTEPDDAELLAAILEQPATDEVREHALRAAESMLEDAEDAEDANQRLVETLSTLAHDDNIPVRDRTRALSALHDAPGDTTTRELVRATMSDNLDVQIEAAYGLTRKDRLDDHRELLAGLVARWPAGDDEPWGARFVRESLEAT